MPLTFDGNNLIPFHLSLHLTALFGCSRRDGLPSLCDALGERCLVESETRLEGLERGLRTIVQSFFHLRDQPPWVATFVAAVQRLMEVLCYLVSSHVEYDRSLETIISVLLTDPILFDLAPCLQRQLHPLQALPVADVTNPWPANR